MKTVYLAGPITGCTLGEANNWRDYVSERLSAHNIRGISPLRCEPLIGERYGVGYTDPRFGVPRAILSKNLYDVRSCDMMLAYMPPQEWPSVGTIWELGIAKAANRPTIVVCLCPKLRAHPVIDATSDWLLTDLEDALDVAIGVLGDYARAP